MSVKISRSGSPAAQISIADSPNLTLPNSDWSLGVVVIFDGTTAGYGGSYQTLYRNGEYGKSGSIIALWNPLDTGTTTAGQFYFQIGSTTNRCYTPPVEAGKAYLLVLQRSGGVVTSKLCPVLTVSPANGAAVSTSAGANVSTEFDGATDFVIGVHTIANRRFDQSVARFFRIDRALTDLEIARLAYGVEITDIGSPAIYMRLTGPSDIVDIGSQQNVVNSQGNLTLGSEPGFGFSSGPRAPGIEGKPVINGAPQVGVPTTYTAAQASGNPVPASGQQWTLDGVVIAGATGASYTPVAADASKQLRVVQSASNSSGTATQVSDPAVVAAEAVGIEAADIPSERVYQRINGAAVVPLSGSYIGTKPSRIEYQLYAPDNATIVRSWADTGATITNNGTWTAAPSIAAPTDGRKFRVAYRSLDSNNNVMFTTAIKPNRFGVGDIILVIGSSSPAAWFGSGSGAGMTPDQNSTSTVENGVWGNFGQYGRAGQMSGYISASEGVPVAMINCALGGSALNQWADNTSTNYKRFSDMVAFVGGKIAGVFGSAGSNDITSAAAAVTVAAHYTKLTTLADNIRATTGQANLPILWRGINRRTDALALQANNARTAERDFGDYANINHVQVLDIEVSSDGVHPTGAGYAVDAARCQYVWAEARKGNYLRGPKIVSMVRTLDHVAVNLRHQGSTDFTPISGITGFTAYDTQDNPIGISAAERETANRITLICAAPAARVTFLEGAAPPMGTPPFGNTTQPLPMLIEAFMPLTIDDAGETTPPADITAPTFTGPLSVLSITSSGATVTGPTATDENGVSGYQISTDGGATFTNAASNTVTLTGLAAATTYDVRMRAYDAAFNYSPVLSTSFTTLSAAPTPDTTAPTFANGAALSISGITNNGATVTAPSATDDVAVAGYQVSVNGGVTYNNAPGRAALLTGLSAGTLIQVRMRAYDAAMNYSAPLAASFTTLSNSNPNPDPDFLPSKVRTIRAIAGGGFSFEGPFWTMGANGYPTGQVDPDSQVDITMDWSDVLADISDSIAEGDIEVEGAVGAYGYTSESSSTVFVDDPQQGGVTIRFRMTSSSEPPRTEDRTVRLTVREQ